MTITQIVDIPLDRRVHLDFEVPCEIPTGQTNVVIQFPVPANPAKKKLTAAEEAAHIEQNFERINAEVMEVLENQADIFEVLENMK